MAFFSSQIDYNFLQSTSKDPFNKSVISKGTTLIPIGSKILSYTLAHPFPSLFSSRNEVHKRWRSGLPIPLTSGTHMGAATAGGGPENRLSPTPASRVNRSWS